MNLPWHPGHLQGATGTAGDLFVFALEPGFSALSLFTALETLQALNSRHPLRLPAGCSARPMGDPSVRPWDCRFRWTRSSTFRRLGR